MSPYEAMLTRELGRYPKVTVVKESGGKHPRLRLALAGVERMLVYPSSASDNHRGVLNKRAELRRLLREMGAAA